MTKDMEKLYERIFTAKAELKRSLQSHGDHCASDMDGACNCGADKTNSTLQRAIAILDGDSR